MMIRKGRAVANGVLMVSCAWLTACDTPEGALDVRGRLVIGNQDLLDAPGPGCAGPMGIVRLPLGHPNAIRVQLWDTDCDGVADFYKSLETPDAPLVPVTAPIIVPPARSTSSAVSPTAPPIIPLDQDPAGAGFDYGLAVAPDFDSASVDEWVAEHVLFLPGGVVDAPLGPTFIESVTPMAALVPGASITIDVTLYMPIGVDDVPAPGAHGLSWYQEAFVGGTSITALRLVGSIDELAAFVHDWLPGGMAVDGVVGADTGDEVPFSLEFGRDGSYVLVVNGETVLQGEG